MPNGAATLAMQARTSSAERGVRIVPRLPDFRFSEEEIPRRWHGGSAGITAFWNAVTTVAPVAEAFFLRDVHALAPRVKESGLQSEMRNFTQQEAFHAMIHRRFNQLLQSWGYPVAEMDRFARGVFAVVEKISSSKLRSAIAVAGEHFIGEIGNVAITQPRVFAGADPRVARLFLWHGYEELEHKAVLFDAFADVHGTGFSSYVHRQLGLLVTIVVLLIVLPAFTLRYMRSEGAARDWHEWGRVLGHVFGREGVLRGRVRAVAAFMHPGFHPWQYRDDTVYLSLRRDVVDEAWERAAQTP
jgi:hypothetical protein